MRPKRESWSLVLGEERSVVYRNLLEGTFEEKIAAYEKLRRKHLGQVTAKAGRLEIRRRIAESLVEAAAGQPWHVFERYLKRLQRLGFTTPDRLVLACFYAAKAAKGDAKAKARVQRLIIRARRALRAPTLPKRYRLQEEAAVLRAEEVLNR